MKKITLLSFVLSLVSFTAFAQDDDFDATENAEVGTTQPVAPKTSVNNDDLRAISEARKARSEEALLRAVSRVLSVDPNHLQALNTLGVFYFEAGKLGLAKIIFNRALAAHPNEPALHNNLGVVYLSEDKQRPAINSFRKAMELNSSYRVGAANLGSIFLEYRDYERAVEALSTGYKAVKGEVKSGAGYAIEVANNYALALMETGQTSEAKKIFESITEENSRNLNVLLNYATLLVERLKDMSAGAKIINRLKFLAEDSKTIRRVDELEAKLKSK